MRERCETCRWASAMCAGLAAFLLARAAGLPIWTEWPTDWSYRDASDVGVLVALAVLFAHQPKEEADEE